MASRGALLASARLCLAYVLAVPWSIVGRVHTPPPPAGPHHCLFGCVWNGSAYSLSSPAAQLLSDGFHACGVVWTEESLWWYVNVDSMVYCHMPMPKNATQTSMYWILDTSVDWAGVPVPSEMHAEHAIDAVRVFGPASTTAETTREVLRCSVATPAKFDDEQPLSADATSVNADDPVRQRIELPDGPIECGTTGTLTVECLGIPFGSIDGRWKRPVPPTPWTELRPANDSAPICMQALCYGPAGALNLNCAEECLFLNVWAPRKLPPAGEPGYPVMIWIHGGAYEAGGAGGAGGAGLAHVEASGGDFIWVTINYRLSVFGFLGAAELRGRDAFRSTGNYGLQDQRLAMQWVQRSAAAFGGDKSNVMIDGCSAGAGSTANHATNSHSWPFFNKVAGESGMFVRAPLAQSH